MNGTACTDRLYAHCTLPAQNHTADLHSKSTSQQRKPQHVYTDSISVAGLKHRTEQSISIYAACVTAHIVSLKKRAFHILGKCSDTYYPKID